jgi:ribose-phosphate pyrophosphokinase
LLFAAPDVGGVSRARSFAEQFNADMVICDKHRKRANEIASMQVIGEVDGRDVVLVDDMIDTGGTLCKAAALLKEKGAKSVRAICTHGLLSGKAFENIGNSVLEELVITDTIPQRQQHPKIKVLTVADMFAKAIRKIHDFESISTLFI